jgi:hypothetical protein
MTDTGSAASFRLERLQESYPAWSLRQDGEQAFTAATPDGSVSMTARSPAELECMLHNEAWKPLTGLRGRP